MYQKLVMCTLCLNIHQHMCLSTIVELFFTVFIVRSTSASLSLSKIISKIFFTLNNTNVCFYLIHAWINCISDKTLVYLFLF